MNERLVMRNLRHVLKELAPQTDVGRQFPPTLLAFDETLAQIQEWLEHGEDGIAYESLVAMLEAHPFSISGPTAIKLLETGLLLGYKTDRREDSTFDRRKQDR